MHIHTSGWIELVHHTRSFASPPTPLFRTSPDDDNAKDGRSLAAALSAPLFTGQRRLSLPLLKWGDLVAVALVHAAAQKGQASTSLRMPVPVISDILLRAAGGAEAVVGRAGTAATTLWETADLVGAVRELVETRQGVFGRHMPMGKGAGLRMQQRIGKSLRTEAQRTTLQVAVTQEGGEGSLQERLRALLAQLACVLADPAQEEVVLELFKETCRRDVQQSQQRREVAQNNAAIERGPWLASAAGKKDGQAAAAAAPHTEL